MPRTHRRCLFAALTMLCVPAALIAAGVLLSGCSSDSDVLARVGTRAITTEDFLEVARGNSSQYPGPPDSAKALLLDDLVRRELLVQGALLQGLHEDTLFMDYRKRIEDQILRERVLRSLAGDGPIPVSDAEVAELYRLRGTESRCRIIYGSNRAAIEAARGELGRGAPFADVANRFNLPGTIPPGGDVGFLAPGSLVQPLDGYLISGPVGQVIGPVEARGQGWFLMLIEERRKREQPPLEAQRAQLADVLRQRKVRLSVTRKVDQLSNAYGVRVLPGAGQKVIEKLRTDPLTAGLGERPPALSEADRATILVEYRGGAYTLGDAERDLNTPSANRPNLNLLPMVERWVESQALERVVLLEALHRGLDQEPEIQRVVRERLNNYLLEGYYTREVVHGVSISPDDLRAAYERRADSFTRLDRATVLTVTLSDSAAAAQLARHGMHAASLREAVAMAAPGARVTERTLQYPSTDPFWGDFQARFIGMNPGDYAGPYPAEQGWLVLQLVSKVQGAQRFEELPTVVLQHLENEALELKREARLRQMTDSLRRAIPVTVNAARLRRIAWPPLPASTPGAAPAG